MKRMISCIIAVMMILMVVPCAGAGSAVHAADTQDAVLQQRADNAVPNQASASGNCGPALTWTLMADGTLTISGTGEMDDFLLSGSQKIAPWRAYNNDIKNVVIQQGVTSVGKYAFRNCANLQSVALPEGLTVIGEGAFSYCTALKAVVIPDGVTVIKPMAFMSCKGLKDISIPESVTEINFRAFMECSSLEKVVLSESITKVDAFAFSYCSNLKEINLSPALTAIREGTFYYCEKMTEVIIPEKVTTIEADAFAYTAVTFMTFPESVKSIANTALEGCAQLNQITVMNETCTVGKDTCYLCAEDLLVIAPRDSRGYTFAHTNGYKYECLEEHLWEDEYSADKRATCIQEGVESIHCSYCDKSDGNTRVVPKTDHTKKAVTALKATCVTAGHKAGVKCSVCDLVISGLEEEKALGHVKVQHAGQDATCTVAGWAAYEDCSRCDYTTYKTIPVKSHSYKAVVKKATCTAGGYTTYTCECGDSYVDNKTDAAGHAFGAYVTTQKATFGKAGVQTATCTRCKTVKLTKSISAVAVPKLSAASYTYNGKGKKPSVTVAGISGSLYTVTYDKKSSVGQRSVKVTFKANANYTGSRTVYFDIKPVKPSSVKLTKGNKQIKVSWKKATTANRKQIDGYQIRYATSKTGLEKVTPKTYSGKTLTNKTIKGLKAKKKYYVQVRTYNKIGKTTYASGWTTVKTVKTK